MKQQEAVPNKKCIFYFKYQLKLQFIPYVEQQIKQFVNLCERKVHDPEARSQILVVLKKRIKQIDVFFQKHWNDYRVQQILRSRKMLVDLTKKYHDLFAIPKDSDVKQDTKQSISMFVQNQEKSIEKGSPKNLKTDRSARKNNKTENIRTYEKSNKNSQEKVFRNSSERNSNTLHTISHDQNTYKTPQQHKTSQQHRYTKYPPNTDKRSKEKRRVSSTESDQIKKVKVRSAKQVPKISPTVKKMTKEEYIAHLRAKKGKP